MSVYWYEAHGKDKTKIWALYIRWLMEGCANAGNDGGGPPRSRLPHPRPYPPTFLANIIRLFNPNYQNV